MSMNVGEAGISAFTFEKLASLGIPQGCKCFYQCELE